MKHHSTVELVNRLEALGAVSRWKDEADRRKVTVQLTPSGSALLRKLSLVHRDELETAGPELIRSLQAVLKNPGARSNR